MFDERRGRAFLNGIISTMSTLLESRFRIFTTTWRAGETLHYRSQIGYLYLRIDRKVAAPHPICIHSFSHSFIRSIIYRLYVPSPDSHCWFFFCLYVVFSPEKETETKLENDESDLKIWSSFHSLYPCL